MLELRSDLIAAPDQVPAVNCQLIVRSELLELPCLELMQRLQEEAEENPALELEYDAPLELPTTTVRSGDGRPLTGDWTDPTLRAPHHFTLRDELHRRVGWALPARLREPAAWLIENIDERGWLTVSTLEAAFELGLDPDEVEQALDAIQRIAPPGVGARNLRECLTLQLDALGDVPPHVRQVADHCEQLLEGDGPDGLRRALGLSRAQLQDALTFIRRKLRPYPGEAFRTSWQHLLPDNLQARRPDVTLTIEGDAITVELTTSRMLRARVAEAYRRLDERMRRMNLRAEDDPTAAARAQVRSARRIIWSLQQRERSLYRIARAIVSEQRGFILDGPLAHRPLTHKRIAEITGLHESTVSRATQGKLVQMPSGESVPFSVFFDDALRAKTVLRSIIAEEPAEAPLSDEQLQDRMEEKGFELARRTVNKYRRALGIPSSSERRRIYRAA